VDFSFLLLVIFVHCCQFSFLLVFVGSAIDRLWSFAFAAETLICGEQYSVARLYAQGSGWFSTVFLGSTGWISIFVPNLGFPLKLLVVFLLVPV
jgi:hypothetical protein